MQWFNEFAQGLDLIPSSVLILFCVIILERIVPATTQYSPLLFFKALSVGISSKVHPHSRQSQPSQQKLAGSLAILILTLPFVFLLYSMMAVVEFPLIFDGLILWMCLTWSATKKSAKSMAKAIKKGNKSLAKARLSPLVLRDTNTLSPMGMYKSAIEMVILRSSKEYFAVIFYYLCFGSQFILLYRLLGLLNQCWNPKISHYRHFGQTNATLCYLLEWLPARLMALTIMSLNNFKLSFKLMTGAKTWGNDSSLFLLAGTAGGLKVSLGGPVIYNKVKLRRPVIGNGKTLAPTPAHLNQTLSLIEKVLFVWCLMIVLVTILMMAIGR
jgi:adenosylcobinamide-phosphate synthase